MLSRESSAALMSAVSAFLYMEARFQDEHQYEAWEALWTDDGIYWVPANGADIDPEKEMSIIYDNRSRISLRIKQLLTGKRHTQTPQSRLRRIVSNIELMGEHPRDARARLGTEPLRPDCRRPLSSRPLHGDSGFRRLLRGPTRHRRALAGGAGMDAGLDPQCRADAVVLLRSHHPRIC